MRLGNGVVYLIAEKIQTGKGMVNVALAVKNYTGLMETLDTFKAGGDYLYYFTIKEYISSVSNVMVQDQENNTDTGYL
jgi:hypothetical protein